MPAPAPVNIRNFLKQNVPNWLADRTGLNTGFSVLFVIALMCDLLLEALLEGAMAFLPGLGTPTALQYVGAGRGLVRGLLETDDEYAGRLRKWLDTWTEAGSEETLVSLLQAYLGGGYVVRHITRRGYFVSVASDGSFLLSYDPTWDWDSALGDLSAQWADTWIVIYKPASRWPSYTSLTDSAFISAWGGEQYGTSFAIPREVVNGVNAIVASFKGAHTWLVGIIWTEDATKFIPGALGGIPAGDFGNWSHEVATVQVPARLVSSSGVQTHYQIPPTGG